MKKAFLILYFCISVFNLISQQADIKFEKLTVENGLSNSWVSCIYKDSKGIMWFGTDYGLNKYDGYECKTYLNEPDNDKSIIANQIITIFEDSNKKMWISTGSQGLNIYNRKNDCFEHTKLKNEEGKEISVRINKIFEDSKKNLWFCTSDGLICFNQKKNSYKKYCYSRTDNNTISNNFVGSINEDEYGNIWAGTFFGLNCIDLKNNIISRYFHNPDNKYSIPHNRLTSIYKDNENKLWFGMSGGGISFFDYIKKQFINIDLDDGAAGSGKNNSVLCISGDKKQNLIIGTEGGGLIIYNTKSTKIKQYIPDYQNKTSLNSNSIHSILVDNNELVWLGTYDGGINYFKLGFNGFQELMPGIGKLYSSKVLSILEDNEKNVWVGTDGGGISKYNPNNDKYTYYLHSENNKSTISSNIVLSIYQDVEEKIWAGTYYNGLNLYNPQDGTFKRFYSKNFGENCIYQIAELKDSTYLLLVTQNALTWFNKKTGEFTNVNIKNNLNIQPRYIYRIFTDSKKQTWVGNSSGLLYIDSAFSKTFIIKDLNPKFTLSPVLSFCETKDGLWLGTIGDGLFKLNTQTYSFTRYSVKEGLASNYISAICDGNDGNLWLSTINGISRLNIYFLDGLENKEQFLFTNYTQYDGLQGNEFRKGSAFKSKEGKIFFGGNNGLNYFYPDSISNNTYIPQIILSHFKIFNQEVFPNIEDSPLKVHISETQEITLTHRQSVFSFEFAALNYFQPFKNKYAYIMEGFEDKMNYVNTKHDATYTNLNPGEYTFKVIASNNDGVWNNEGTSIKLKILPPWWNALWFRILLVITISGILLFIYYYRILSLEKNKKLLEDQVAERTSQVKDISAKLHESDQNKLRFFINISHEFRTPLTLILGTLDKLISEGKNMGWPSRLSQYQITRRNSLRLLQLINQLLDISKFDMGSMKIQVTKNDIIEFITSIKKRYEELAKQRNRILILNKEVANLETYFDHDKIEKILDNLVSNAFKFTNEGNTIEISISGIIKIDELPEKEKIADKLQKSGFKESALLKISVKDNGIGIEEDDPYKVFERYYQGNNKKSGLAGGTGIGLHMVKEFTELMHGTITLSSTPQKETIFTIYIPANKNQYNPDEIQEIQISQTENILYGDLEKDIVQKSNDNITKNIIPSRNKTILIVEDNIELQNYLITNFAGIFIVTTAKNGVEGLERAIEIVPDLIISDIMMPEMNGFELCKKIKSDLRVSHIPVILLTARTTEQDQIKGYETEADDYITKPFSLNLLVARVNNLIEIRKKLRENYSKLEDVKPQDITLNSTDEKFIIKTIKIIEDNFTNTQFGVELLSSEIGISRVHLYRKLEALTNLPPSAFIRNVRIKKAAELLKETDEPVSDIMFKVGFDSRSYFAKSFKQVYNINPSEYRANHQSK